MVSIVTERTDLGPGNANLDRFSGFADLYDANRPTAPDLLGPVLAAYAGVSSPFVVDLGSGTGLSSRWAASWAGAVVGIEPNADMRAQAAAVRTSGVDYRAGTSNETGLPSLCADVVVAVQAMHWMEPESTLREVARILRPGGVFATIDADWPPVTGLSEAESAWQTFHRRIRVFDARADRGASDDELRAEIDEFDPALVDEDLRDPHRNRALAGGVQSWSKAQHLDRIERSGHFAFARELVFDQPLAGGADRFIALMRSQGSYQALRRLGLTDDELGATAFEQQVRHAYEQAPVELPPMSFSWRIRLGVKGVRRPSPEGPRSVSARVVSVNIGRVREVPYLGRTETTAIFKEPTSASVTVTRDAFGDDRQADLSVHGGPDRVAYAYASEDLAWWASELGREVPPGSMGENLTTTGLDITNAVIGERWRIGTATFEVAALRSPCFKLGIRMGIPRFSTQFADAARPGAYLRVAVPGSLSVGDGVEVVHRPTHGVTMALLADAYHRDPTLAARLLDAPELSDEWRRWAEAQSEPD